MKNIKVGIIGGTNGMGRWFAGLLKNEGCTVYVCGRKTELGINDLARLCNVVVVAVPISATTDIIKQVGPLLTKDALLMDLTSLKHEPVKLMLANSKAEVIGCHPLFGPALKDVSKQNVVLCPARGKKWLPWLKNVFKKNKLTVLEATPEKHDKMMAIVQALNHLNTISLGMALARTNITLAEINKFSTPIFRTKLDIIKKVFTESPELYIDIITKNTETIKMLDIYEKALKDIRAKIKSGNKNKSKEAVANAAKKLYGSKNK
ncbi:MAG: prephenate dehydrogenase/arogenate dehydrogenase family protein [Deltaproteobacteria bacterium]|nr:prephenate dehydrogenase/arogenate dehydrogenase family protein [Deltaproteobacteria bacterium]